MRRGETLAAAAAAEAARGGQGRAAAAPSVKSSSRPALFLGEEAALTERPAPSCRHPSPRPGRHEPRLALDGGEGLGIDALMPICTGAVAMLAPGGFLALETAGGEQAAYVASVLSCMRGGGGGGWAAGQGGDGDGPAFVGVRVRRDLAGVDRFVTASRAGESTQPSL